MIERDVSNVFNLISHVYFDACYVCYRNTTAHGIGMHYICDETVRLQYHIAACLLYGYNEASSHNCPAEIRKCNLYGGAGEERLAVTSGY